MVGNFQIPDANLQFIRQGEYGFVGLAPATGGHRDVFPLCPLSSNLVDWLVNACQSFWLEHQRCVAFAILFQPALQHWSIELPQQRCCPGGFEWLPGRVERPPQLSSYFLAGSFQSQPATSESLPVPTFPGMHFVLRVQSGAMQLHAFMRWGPPDDRCERVTTHYLIQNDYERTLQLASPRILHL